MSSCGIIPARQENIVGYTEDYFAECILPVGHVCPHIVRTPEGRYFQWEEDWECECCGPEEVDRCYDHGEITEARARELIIKEAAEKRE